MLLAAGVRREERVLLLMHDCNDWPVAFLGSMYAGIVPVAVNTLLTADDYSYMLQHSRAQAALVSNALLPTLREAMQKGAHELRAVFVSGADGDPGDSAQSLENGLQQAEPQMRKRKLVDQDRGERQRDRERDETTAPKTPAPT